MIDFMDKWTTGTRFHIVVGVLIFLLMFTVYLAVRLEQVHSLREKTNLTIYTINNLDTDNRIYHTQKRRWHKYEAVSFNEMLYTFWKPVKLASFYKDVSFVKRSKGGQR